MCKKLLILTTFILLLESVSSAADIQWTGAGRNKFWNTVANWDQGRLPTLADEVLIDVPAAAAPNGPVIQDGIDAKAKGILTEAAGEPTLTMTGGTLEVAEWIWWGDGRDSFAIWTMSGGTVTVANEFELGWDGGAGTLTMTGGTITAGEAVIPTDSGAFGELFLYGGTYNVTKPGGLEVNANGLIDITEGTLVLEGDDTAKVNDLFTAGLITALGGVGILEVDYDVRNAGKTTVTAALVPPEIEPVKPSDAGLVAYYALENDVLDGSGNGLDGTIMGDPAFVIGQVGMALDFDGDGDYVDCGTNDTLNGLSEAMTASAWINIRSITTEWMAIMAKGENAWRISVNSTSMGLHFGFTGGDRDYQAANSESEIAADEWHHVAATYALDPGATIYIDGVADGSNPDAGGVQMNEASFLIGDNPEATGRFFDGLIDEVTIYGRTLSAAEVKYLAGHRATPVNPGTDGLVAHYEFENDVNDSSVNGLHGTIVGDPEFVEGPPGLGMALDFDGDGDYVDCGNPPEFSITDQISFAYWIKVRAFDRSWNTVIAKGDDSWRSSRAGENNFMEAAVGGTSGNYLYGATPVDDEQWHHVAAVYDGATFKLYVDGGLDGLEESTGQIAVSSHNVAIGENLDATGRFWNGQIDDVVIYNRALSVGEVMYLVGHRPVPVDPGAEGLMAHYPLDGNANDSSGNGIDGTIHNADTGGLGDGGSVWVDDPERGTVISFNGTADSAYVRAGEIPQMTLTNDFTWAFWAKQKAENTLDNDIILGNRMDENAVDFAPRQFIKFTPTKFEWHMNANPDDNLEYEDIPADVWLHHAVVKTADQLTYYRNGIKASSGMITQPLDVPQPLFFGGDNEGLATENWNGLMSDVCLYNRALSDSEILYLAGYREPAEAPAPLGHWTLDEGAGTTIADSSGNGNDGTLVDNPVWDIAWITGVSGGAVEFYGVGTANGNGDYFDCGSDPSLNMTGPISIALWIRPDADDPEGQATTTAPMSKTDGSDWSWQVRYGWNSPQPYMAFTFNSAPRAWAYVGQNLVQGEWCHIACSHDGATLKCYLDGAETDSTPMGQFAGVGTPVLIGTDGWGCDWIGAIDDVRIYDVGLSEDEILDIVADL